MSAVPDQREEAARLGAIAELERFVNAEATHSWLTKAEARWLLSELSRAEANEKARAALRGSQ